MVNYFKWEVRRCNKESKSVLVNPLFKKNALFFNYLDFKRKNTLRERLFFRVYHCFLGGRCSAPAQSFCSTVNWSHESELFIIRQVVLPIISINKSLSTALKHFYLSEWVLCSGLRRSKRPLRSEHNPTLALMPVKKDVQEPYCVRDNGKS